MDYYEINSSQFIPESIENVFSFFSKPENLEKITPNYLHFTIITQPPIQMKIDQLIDYKIRIRGIPIFWRSIIREYSPPYHFIDEQIKGPYSFWHHTHTFVEKNGGTYIKDKVLYKIPFGFIGKIMNYLWISKDLEKIFFYRKEVIAKFFKCEIIE